MKTIARLMISGTLLLGMNAQAEIAIIVAPSVQLDSIDIQQLERLYLARPNRYPNGVKLDPADQASGSGIRQEFTRKVLLKTENEVAEYWSRRMFSGKGKPPHQYKGDEAVINGVLEWPGSLGYIDSESVDDRVKVLTRLP
ncbi:hypothetical protein MNBD_GAMMA13-1701 [hydrothermal vent metagenome]|uniref:Phosphate ABC transporter substrate-binding protein n=1 Tax=hydrothermal vent metagenome TaxID=652676 RepID=A0A3B0YA21_9ZZZZ